MKRDKILEKARKKAVRSSIMSDLRKEFTDQPEEIYVSFVQQHGFLFALISVFQFIVIWLVDFKQFCDDMFEFI